MKNLLINAIRNSKQQYITYEEFMAYCLYEPEIGYYQKSNQKIGRKGDFYTSSSVGTVYGEVIASVFCRLVKDKLINSVFVEIGGGNGRFASSFLNYCEKNEPDIYKELTYSIIDESNYHTQLQKKILEQHNNVHYFSHISQLQMVTKGMIFSNELFDALPVRVVEFHQNKWHEVVITCNESNQLIEKLVELNEDVLIEFLTRNHFKGKDGQRIEVPIVMENLFHLIQEKLKQGLIITVDYGFTREEWEAPHRVKGSLRGYYEHEMKTNILDFIGEMDLTTHIHWDELIHIGEERKIHTIYFNSQRNALVHFGILNHLVQHASLNPFSDEYKHNRAIQSLIMPGGISDSFQLLIQTKGISDKDQLTLTKRLLENEYK